MTIEERKKQLRSYKFWFFWGVFILICFIPCGIKYFGCSACYPTAGLTAMLTDMQIDAIENPTIEEKPIETVEEPAVAEYSPNQLKRLGVIRWGGHKFTWYSQRVLPGGGLKIPGRHVNSDGYVMDEDGFICGASQMHKKGTVLDSPFGYKVKIYDWCDIDSIDIYTDF